ncbi:MAG: methyltransferase domain-containing protein [Candidatus Marinimicrobia bacterium]|nr:methyltransferase domain-containing protein [Candidatus Neomarinimicrobiota bacterium]
MSRDQAAYFDQAQPYLEETADRRVRRIQAFLATGLRDRARAGQAPPAVALDVGCGPGAMLATLPAETRKVGVDIAPALLERAAAKGIETHNLDLDSQPLPAADDSCDLVIATDVIEHVLHTDHLLNEINRVLKIGGLFVAGIPNVNQPASFIMQFILDLTPMYAARYRCPHYRDFSARLFKAILRRHGFHVRRCEGSYLFPFDGFLPGIWLVRQIPRWGAQVLVAAEKQRNEPIPEGYQTNMPDLLAWLTGTH